MAAKNTKSANNIVFPSSIIKPVGLYLRAQIKKLQKRKKEIASDDPFKNINRISDSAAIDADAEEQFGHERVVALKHQLDKKIIQSRRALARVRIGKYGVCENCARMIDTDRLTIYPEATLCIRCERKQEKK